MNLSAVEKELLHLQALVARWNEQNNTPSIERDLALAALRKIYDELLNETPAHQRADEEQATEPLTHQNTPAAAESEPCSYDERSEAAEAEETVELEEELAIDQIAQVIDNLGQPHQEEPTQQEPAEQEQPEQEAQAEEQHYPYIDQAEGIAEIEIEPIQEIEEYQQHPAQPSQDNDGARRGRFIHDLFCNDESFYLGEMRKIEALTSLDDVLIYIGQKYAWTPQNETAEEFVAWIATRFND